MQIRVASGEYGVMRPSCFGSCFRKYECAARIIKLTGHGFGHFCIVQKTISDVRSMPTENIMVDRFTLFGVHVHIQYDNRCEAVLHRLTLSRWNTQAPADDPKSIYIVIRTYAVNQDIPEDTFI